MPFQSDRSHQYFNRCYIEPITSSGQPHQYRRRPEISYCSPGESQLSRWNRCNCEAASPEVVQINGIVPLIICRWRPLRMHPVCDFRGPRRWCAARNLVLRLLHSWSIHYRALSLHCDSKPAEILSTERATNFIHHDNIVFNMNTSLQDDVSNKEFNLFWRCILSINSTAHMQVEELVNW